MLAVHALWSPGRGVLLWAEDGERPVTSSSRSLRSARPHPFAATAAALAALHPGKPTGCTLLLPSRAGGPLASPELVRSETRGGAARSVPALRPWTVPALVVDVAELGDPADEARYGASVAHLRAVAELADELAARGRVLPTLVREGGVALARWRPVVRGLDVVALDALVAALPPVARAEQTGPRDQLGGDPRAHVEDALAVLTDIAVRDRLARAPEPVALVPSPPSQPVPATEAWLAALVTPDARVADVDPRELDTLADELGAWDGFGTVPTGEGRASFRLSEVRTLHDPSDPGDDAEDQTGDGTRWILEFFLQSTADPSLLLPAAQVWSGRAERLVAEPQDLLLGELGRAALVLPALAPALRSARPEMLELDNGGAARFLAVDAPLLIEAGFGVQLPTGWDGSRRVGLSLSARSTPTDRVLTRGGLGREELADFRWSVAVGDEELSEEELTELVAAKAELVRVRGRWVTVDADRLRAGLEFLRRGRKRPTPTVAEVLSLAQRHPDDWAGDDDVPLPVTEIHAEGWIGDLLEGRAERSITPVEPPPGFLATLRPYQARGLSWLAFLSSLGLGACLADDMGLGKTVQLLALEARERSDQVQGPTLLLCPMSLVGTWQREAARFAPDLRILAHHGPTRLHGPELTAAVRASDIVVTTYATATRDADELAEIGWRRLVLDEAQAVKNSRASHARAVRRFDAEHRVALTGTPVENRLSELWSVMDVLNPGLLGTADAFRARYAIPVERHGDTEAAERLRTITRPYLLRRIKTDPTIIDDLPEKIEINQHYRLTPEQASLYRTVVDDMMEKIEDSQGIQRRGNVLSAMAKLKQVCNHPAQLLHDGSAVGRRSGKVIRLEEILGEILDEGDRVLCFTQFTEFGHMLVPHLSARFDTDIAFLHGGTPKKRRDEMVARFQEGDGPPVMLLSLKAGGTGLTLTAANHVVHLDRWWNPAVENQATDRAFRIGQRRNVQVRKFVCPGTVEERIDAMITKKKALSGMVVGEGENWLTELSTDTLREMFALDAGAVEDD
ncbi:DEAD/DEAH box helicase [Pseudonocardia sp.]|uniref:DEAD/DEAH box helicase n=1 Tax=Pseudonocardia sp. TaxID=60912 RepID=UPI00260202CC|nr:DEAD/DEAH box helicase [Pseudonocardia sp.]MCW2719680.1 ATP-dependent helicase [Pseudonocardia sp.]